METEHAREIASGTRFKFGANWSRFLSLLDDERIDHAERSLAGMLDMPSLRSQRFLDIGSGSGLFSLAARRLGATVVSFDYDPQSVACTDELRRRYCPEDSDWQVVGTGSVLDQEFLATLGQFDVVYSWGVLHHTGHMMEALANAADRVKPGGRLFIAIYNDQGATSRYWRQVKRAYNANAVARVALPIVYAPYLVGLRWLARAATGRLAVERGMSLWYDMIDWLGGYPFEVAKPEVIFDFHRQRGFQLEKLHTCGGRCGCNEFVFSRPA